MSILVIKANNFRKLPNKIKNQEKNVKKVILAILDGWE